MSIPISRPSSSCQSNGPNIESFLRSIPDWSDEEQRTLEQNMKKYPQSENTGFKRLTLLMSNLPNKRLRDVSLRVKYMKANEDAYESFVSECGDSCDTSSVNKNEMISWRCFLEN